MQVLTSNIARKLTICGYKTSIPGKYTSKYFSTRFKMKKIKMPITRFRNLQYKSDAKVREDIQHPYSSRVLFRCAHRRLRLIDTCGYALSKKKRVGKKIS